jgi:hypothetical protein
MTSDPFGLTDPPYTEEEEEADPTPAPSPNGLNSMLGDFDDSGFLVPPAQASFASQPPSALVQWEREKALELTEKDNQDQAAAEALRAAAADRLNGFYDRVRAASAKRASHNAELDAQRQAALEGNENPWVTVGDLSTFERTDLHVKDVSAMNKLLISLKTKPPHKA